MKRLLSIVLFVSAQHGMAGIHRSAVSFDRFQIDDPAKVESVKEVGNLSGTKEGQPSKGIGGWFEYDFDISITGWYELQVEPSGHGHEFTIDGTDLYYGLGPKIGNLWLAEGKHALRIERNHWTGFGKISGWTLTPAGPDAASRIAVRTTNLWKVIRQGESLPVTVSFGELAAPVKLSLLVRERGRQDVLQTIPVNLPAGGGFQQTTVAIPGSRQGVYEVGYQVDELAPQATVLPPLLFAVVDTTPVAPKDGEVEKTLVAEIDLAKQEPDYFKGGATRVVNKPWGSYRESGDVGYLQHMNSTEPSWFAYRYQVDDPDALYWMEFDFPDDARRSFLVVPRSGSALSYAGPGTGPDTGREFALTNRMQTMGIYFWPHSTDLRAAVLQPQSGLRAAVSKIRIYKVENNFAPLPHVKDGREFIHWYEEGSSFMGYFGAQNKSPESVIVSADNWARIMASMGASMLMPTFSIYQMAMYPSSLNSFSDSNTFDAARVIELACERYGLKFAAEFHPEGRGLKTVSALATSPDSICQFNRFGKVWDGGEGPKFNFLNPVVEKFALDLVGEFADRYGDSPAFDGVSIRLMGWQNTGFGNFSSLNWGYGDFTICLFERETQTKVPVPGDDPERFEKRYQWLMANAKDQWIAWRCQKATEFFAKVSDRLRGKHPEAKLFLNDFLVPGCANSKDWYEGFPTAARDAGIDPARLAKVPGVELLNSTVSYGRRNVEAVDQRQRDALLNPEFLGVLKQEGKALGFLTTQAYFEATEAIAPPRDMGYPEKTAHDWMSGSVNPAGRNYLERFALALAESDAATLGDGGNGYTVGQPLLREFLREYRALPREKFQPRPEARDPVAVWERPSKGDFLFYAVNRERYPVQVEIQFATPPDVRRLATGKKVPAEGTTLRVELQPFELRAFAASGEAAIRKVTARIPDSELERVQSTVDFLRALAGNVAAGKVGSTLNDAEKQILAVAALEANQCLKEGRYWRARTLQEDERLRGIYAKCQVLSPLLDQNGPPVISESALAGETLLAHTKKSKDVTLVDSQTATPEWAGQKLVVSQSDSMEVSFEIPIEGKYQLKIGHAAGGEFGASTIRIGNREIGRLESVHGPVHPDIVTLPPLSFSKGQQTISFERKGGKSTGMVFFEAEPVYEDIVMKKWLVAGPFLAADKPTGEIMAEIVKNKVLPPEENRTWNTSFDDGQGGKLHWHQVDSTGDYIDFYKETGRGLGSVNYATTFVISPSEREAELSYSSDFWAKIWLNGQPIKDLYQPLGHPVKGQTKQTIKLLKGPNEILIKVAAGTVGNGFWMAINNPGDLQISPLKQWSRQ